MSLSPDNIDAVFSQVAVERHLTRRIDQVRDPHFWRALAPELTISDFPLAPPVPRIPIAPEIVEHCRQRLLAEGYLATPPVIPVPRVQQLARVVQRIVDEGFPSGMAAVFDEFYRLVSGLDDLFAPLLGPDYFSLTQGGWAFHVAPGTTGRELWSGGAEPHRDSMGVDARVIAGQCPTALTIWVPLTDVATDQSCVYVVPADTDRSFRTSERQVDRTAFRLQDIRALPVRAGSVLAWSSHLIHWGSASSRFSDEPRMAIATGLQRGDVAPRHPFHIDPARPVTFEDRLMWIDHCMGRPGLLSGRRLVAS